MVGQGNDDGMMIMALALPHERNFDGKMIGRVQASIKSDDHHERIGTSHCIHCKMWMHENM